MNAQWIQGIIALVAFILLLIVAGIGFFPAPSVPPPTPIIAAPTAAPTAQSAPPPLVIPTHVLVSMGVCSSTPSEAVVRTMQTTPALRDFGVQVHGTFAWERGTIVVYTTTPPKEGSSTDGQFVNYVLMVQESCGWRMTEHTDSYILPTNSPDLVTSASVYAFYSLVFGHVRCKQDLTVGVAQPDGSYTVERTKNGFFAFATTNPTSTLSVLLFDRDQPVSSLDGESRQLQDLCL